MAATMSSSAHGNIFFIMTSWCWEGMLVQVMGMLVQVMCSEYRPT